MSEFIKRVLTTAIILPATLGALLFAPLWLLHSMVFCILLVILTTEWPKLFSYKTVTFWALMPFYPIAPFLALFALIALSRSLMVYMVLAVAAHDVGSYCAGKLVGKHTIMPTVSPGKTWEGFIGGYCATFLTTMYFFPCQAKHEYCIGALLALLISSTALAGDLWQSYLKRCAGLKDTGSLLPGHGGLLDRLDALMFVAMLFYICIPA